MKRYTVTGEFLKKAPSSPYLYHQKRTLDELRSNSVVFNTYPTGAGKTIASLLYLKENINVDTLFIAPTNELLRQHSEDIKEFVSKNKLPHIVVKIDASVIEKLREGRRKGATLYEVLSNPLQFREELSIENIEYDGKRPVIVVVNPDIFYYCFYSLYGNNDKGNLMDIVIKKFNYIVIDEFHYYNSKQLANFLFFMILSKEFNYFKYGRKMCILTATPDALVEQYLKRGGIEYKIISNENENLESEAYEKLKTLSELDLYVTNKTLDEVVCERYKDNPLKNDCVVISQSIYRVNKLKDQLINSGLSKNDIGIITGAIKSDERKNAVAKHLIIATPTVDIGYNFKKQNKQSQNIDEVITEANTCDQALQRLGRAGRILGKKVQNERSKVVICVTDEVYESFEEKTGEISRLELKELIRKSMPERNIMKKYIETKGILELCFPMKEMDRKMSQQNKYIIRNLFDMIISVFAPKSKENFKGLSAKINKYKTQCIFINEYNKSSEKKEVVQNIDNKLFIDFYKNYCQDEDTEEVVDDSMLDDFSEEEIKILKADVEEELVHYINSEITKVKSLINFRGSDISKPALVFDKYYKFGQEHRLFVYDIFHLMKYYEIDWYENKRDFEKAAKITLSDYEEEANGVDKIDIFIIVNGIRENAIEITWEYSFKGDQDAFDEKYTNKVEAINNLNLVGYEYTTRGREGVALPEKITKAFKESYIAIYTISQEPKEEYKIRKIIKNQPIFLQKLKVQFPENEKEYFIITGTNGISVDSEVVKMRSKSIKEEFFIV
ncbi:type I-D CRISPR-associated helicase Cas3' [Clostridium estertheticum]|uniref:type I-D CRISPR-associated helicase Cas3' n=1 Tax=Clostridium estertheticum TaxID=238834 RepID=UPI001C6F32F3|nr:type I-D CRISPR-associated helicase Cas3' [Clostridium estertheticum]MBW9152363.1 type I-D CRISPR-associated helicase Cas3' [Clostridium estertheticum]WLC82782.1 type I-D CRISPR-associated helicase Cas3' [Clostridium estertheticum]